MRRSSGSGWATIRRKPSAWQRTILQCARRRGHASSWRRHSTPTPPEQHLLVAAARTYPIEQHASYEETTMDAKVIQNERTTMAQVVARQPDGPGRRIGKRGELTAIGKVTPDGARIFRERLPQFQAEAAYWENR